MHKLRVLSDAALQDISRSKRLADRFYGLVAACKMHARGIRDHPQAGGSDWPQQVNQFTGDGRPQNGVGGIGGEVREWQHRNDRSLGRGFSLGEKLNVVFEMGDKRYA